MRPQGLECCSVERLGLRSFQGVQVWLELWLFAVLRARWQWHLGDGMGCRGSLQLWKVPSRTQVSGEESLALVGSIQSQKLLQAPSLMSWLPRRPPKLHLALRLAVALAQWLALVRLVRSQALIQAPSLASWLPQRPLQLYRALPLAASRAEAVALLGSVLSQ